MKRFSIIFCFLTIVILTRGQSFFHLKLQNNTTVYQVGEPFSVDIVVDEDAFSKLNNKKFTLTYGEEGTGNFQYIDGVIRDTKTTVSLPSIDVAQVLRINVRVALADTLLSQQVGVVIDSENLAITTVLPKDFSSFWEKQLTILNDIPLNPTMEHVTSLSSDLVDVYHVSYVVDQGGSRFYGVLTVPKVGSLNKKHAAVIIYPGAGVRSYSANTRFAQAGIVTLQIGVHGIPINLDPSVYSSLRKGALDGYLYFNLQSRELYYFNRVIKGSVRALDFLETLDQVDKERIMVSGSSQGGALSLIVTGLDSRVKAVAAYCPALCQTNGSLFGKASGWPQPLKRASKSDGYYSDWNQVMPYYDVVNFAKSIRVPVYMTWGLIDDVTPASTVFAAYNSISSKKSYYLLPDVAHANHPTQISAVYDFITGFFESK